MVKKIVEMQQTFRGKIGQKRSWKSSTAQAQPEGPRNFGSKVHCLDSHLGKMCLWICLQEDNKAEAITELSNERQRQPGVLDQDIKTHHLCY